MILCFFFFFCVAVCADNNHVRTWTVTRFRGMISTQPGSTPLASFKIISLEETESHSSYSSGNDIGEWQEEMTILKGPCLQETQRRPSVHLDLALVRLYKRYRNELIYLFTYRPIRRERRPTSIHSEGHSDNQQTLCASLLHWKEVCADKKKLYHVICLWNVNRWRSTDQWILQIPITNWAVPADDPWIYW